MRKRATPKTEEYWAGFNWDQDSQAVVASDGAESGAVLWTGGPHVLFQLEKYGANNIYDLGLGNAPHGVSIWTGKYTYGSELDGTLEGALVRAAEAHGKFREPTPEEWKAIRASRCPWDGNEWRLTDKKRKQAEAPLPSDKLEEPIPNARTLTNCFLALPYRMQFDLGCCVGALTRDEDTGLSDSEMALKIFRRISPAKLWEELRQRRKPRPTDAGYLDVHPKGEEL